MSIILTVILEEVTCVFAIVRGSLVIFINQQIVVC